jgi:hypothetical protein
MFCMVVHIQASNLGKSKQKGKFGLECYYVLQGMKGKFQTLSRCVERLTEPRNYIHTNDCIQCYLMLLYMNKE